MKKKYTKLNINGIGGNYNVSYDHVELLEGGIMLYNGKVTNAYNRPIFIPYWRVSSIEY